MDYVKEAYEAQEVSEVAVGWQSSSSRCPVSCPSAYFGLYGFLEGCQDQRLWQSSSNCTLERRLLESPLAASFGGGRHVSQSEE